MKTFGKRARAVRPAPREPFEFTFIRDEKPETHQFQARARADVVSLSNTLQLAKNSPEAAMPEMLRLISRMLDNKDGTPLNWQPAPLDPRKRPEVAEAAHSLEAYSAGGTIATAEQPEPDDEDERELVFRGPDGELYPLDRAEEFTTFAAGSSRRRWNHLMVDDDDVEVDAKDLMELFEWLIGLAAGRPTRPSA